MAANFAAIKISGHPARKNGAISRLHEGILGLNFLAHFRKSESVCATQNGVDLLPFFCSRSMKLNSAEDFLLPPQLAFLKRK